MRRGVARGLVRGLMLVLVTGSPVALARQGVPAEPPPPRVDAASGRDLLNYPPDPAVQFERMRLELDIPDMNSRRMLATQTLTLAPIAGPVSTLRLDARLLLVSSVTSPGRLVGFRHDGQALLVTLDPPVERGERAEIVTSYVVSEPTAGLVWTTSAESAQPPQLHSQGQAEMNSYWFPIHDFPNVRLGTEVIVTVPAGFEAMSNGRLVSREVRDDGRARFHYVQEQPHAPYLVSLIVGQFDTVDVARANRDRVPMPVLVPPGRGNDARETFARTPEMVEVFERVLEEAYPWDKYGQVVVWNFESGGMENTSVTTLYDGAVLSAQGRAEGDMDDLIAHELAHQWFGDLITCKSWEHLWLNEGFATYMESVWTESRRGRDAALVEMLGNLDQLGERDRAEVSGAAAMVSKAYAEPDDVFGKPSNPYSKGALVLHMLRAGLGDEVFWSGMRAYIDRYKFKQVETGDFRRVMEEVSGESLERFFQQWCMRPGLPRLDVDLAWEGRAGSSEGDLVVTVRQTQRIDGDHPAFVLDVPLWISPEPGRARVAEPAVKLDPVRARGRETVATYRLAERPASVSVDPEVSQAAVLNVRQSERAWLREMRVGATTVARIRAARALSGAEFRGSAEAASALEALAGTPGAPVELRVEAIRALGRRGDRDAVTRLGDARVSESRLRLAIVEAAGDMMKASGGAAADPLTRLLLTAADGDPSVRARSRALELCGELELVTALPAMRRAMDTPSDGDRVRIGAAKGLGMIGSPEAVPLLARMALPGLGARTRAEAIESLAKVARFDERSVLTILEQALSDTNREVRRAAAEALGAIGTPDARQRLEAGAKAARDPSEARRLGGLAAGAGTTTGIANTGADAMWVPIDTPSAWANDETELEAFKQEPARVLGPRGIVAEATANGPAILVRRDPGSALGWGDGGVSAGELRAVVDGQGVIRGVVLGIAPASQQAVRAFTGSRIGSRLGVIVDGQVVGVLAVTNTLAGEVRWSGRFTAEDVVRIRAGLGRGVGLAVLVKPGERGDEAALRARVRGDR